MIQIWTTDWSETPTEREGGREEEGELSLYEYAVTDKPWVRPCLIYHHFRVYGLCSHDGISLAFLTYNTFSTIACLLVRPSRLLVSSSINNFLRQFHCFFKLSTKRGGFYLFVFFFFLSSIIPSYRYQRTIRVTNKLITQRLRNVLR